ncbi:MAG: hypothetical protein AAGE43_08995 [Pseudomonadota bacterium]
MKSRNEAEAKTKHAETERGSRSARGEATRQTLMRAAETLIADRGIESVTIREILDLAEQKNTSALQYHFGNLRGLIAAIQRDRAAETVAKREELLAALLARTEEPTLRELCELMVRPAFELASADAGFRNYIQAFGHQLALIESSALDRVGRGGAGGSSGQAVAERLKATLTGLDEATYRQRMEFAVRLCAASIYQHAQQRSAFRGKKAELFISSLIDALAGLLSAPESTESRALR